MTKKLQLSNGLKVVLKESKKSPVVTVQMWVATGSADELPGEEGMSHFIEHLLFKGTEKFEVGEIARLIESSGGELNAYTSLDKTVYHVTLSKDDLDTGIEVIQQMVGFPQFVQDEIDNEREVVIEEIKRSKDDPQRRSSRVLFESVYGDGPYGKPILGVEETLTAMSRDDILKYFKGRYSPSNMVFVVVGDFSAKEVEAKVKKSFGQMKKAPVRKTAPKKINSPKGFTVQTDTLDFNEAQIHLAWPTVKVGHRDMAALDVLSLILGQGESSRLNQQLRINNPLVNWIYASSYTPKEDGFLAISAGFNLESLPKLLEGLADEIFHLLSDSVTEQEIKKAIINLESDEYYSMETVDGLARKLGTFQLLLNDIDYFPKYMKQVEAITANDIRKVLKKYLTPDNLRVALLKNTDTSTESELIYSWHKEFEQGYQDVLLMENKAESTTKKTKKANCTLLKGSTEEPKKVTLPTGTEVILLPSFDSPTVSVRAAFLGGLRAESGPEGVAELVAETWLSGSKEMSETEVHMAVDEAAASYRSFSGRNSFGVAIDMLSNQQNKMREIFAKTFSAPLFPEDIINREKTVMLEQQKSRLDTPSYLCARKFIRNLFGDHPYSRDSLGTPESLSQIGQKELFDYWSRLSESKNLKFALVGAFDEDQWLETLTEQTKNLEAGSPYESNFSVQSITEDKKLYQQIDREQSHIIVGVQGLNLKDDRRYALHILQAILAGQGGRLFIELRDKQSLAYSVAPIRLEGIETGYFGAYIACSPDKAKQAIDSILEQFDKISNHLPPEEEVERAKRYLIGRHDIDLQRNSSIASSFLFNEIYGIPFSEVYYYRNKLRTITAEDVCEIGKHLFDKAKVFSVAGKMNPFE
jgi:zinc protease